MAEFPQNREGSDPDSASFLLEQTPWVRRIARSMLRNEDDARDLTQDVMVEALASEVPNEGPKLRAWLRTVTRRLAMRRYRRRSLEENFMEREHGDLAAAMDGPRVGRADEFLQLHEELIKALRDLDPEDRALLVQRYVDGVTPMQLARQAGVPPNVMRKRLSRALARIRVALGRRLGPTEDARLQADRLKRALAVLALPLPIEIPAASRPETFTTLSWTTMGLQKTILIAGAMVVLSTVALLRSGGVSSDVEPLRPAEAPAMEVASLEAPDGQLRARRGVELMATPARSPLQEVELAEAIECAYVEFRSADDEPLLDVTGVWIDHVGELHSLAVGEDGRSPLPAEARLQIVAGAPNLRTVFLPLDALAAGAVETILLQAKPKMRIEVTIDGLPPRERIRFPMNVGGVKMAGGVSSLDLRAREELGRMGLVDTFPRMETDGSGLIDVELPGNISALTLGVPPGFLVNTINGAPWTSLSSVMRLDVVPGVTSVDLHALAQVSGRMVWDDTGEPYVGDARAVRTFAGSNVDDRREEFVEFQTDSHGRFSVAKHELVQEERMSDGGVTSLAVTAGGRAALSVGVEAKAREVVPSAWHTFQVNPHSTYQEVGVIRVQRLPRVRVRILGTKGEGFEPIVAGVGSSVGAVTTGRDGVAELCVGPEGWVDVLSPGYQFVRVTPPHVSVSKSSEQVIEPWTVKLAEAPSLRVRMPEALLSAGPKFEARVTLRYAESPFGSFADPSAAQPELSRDLYSAVFGLRHEQQRAVGDSAVSFYARQDGLVSIPGLRSGAALTVQWTDCIGGVFAEESLLFDGGAQELSFPGDAEPAFVSATVFDARGLPARGGMARIQGSGGGFMVHYFEAARLSLGPLASGTCGLKLFSNTGGRFETRDFQLASGQNAIDIEVRSP